jgi:hypothetical protein
LKHNNLPESIVKVDEKIRDILVREMEFSQSRTSFQIEKFIGCSEYSPVTKYRHLVHNQYVLLTSLKRDIIEIERAKRKINKLDREKTENYDLDLLEISMKIEALEISVNGKTKELIIFEKLIKELESNNGGPFSYDQLEDEQPEYWKKRLATQAHLFQAGNVFGIPQGNYEAVLQALEEPILKGSKNQIDNFPIGKMGDSFDILATMSLIDRDGINTKLLKEKEDV